MRACTQQMLRAGYIFCALLFSFTVQADRSDWVAVERFESQLKQAEVGKVSAMYETARMYERGRGTDLDYSKAAMWYEKASSGGHAPSIARLGLLYFEGRGVKQNHKKAYELLSQASRENIPSAQYQLGIMYQYGTGVAQNKSKAIYWFQKARDGGDYRSDKKLKELKNQQVAVASAAITTTAKQPTNNRKKTTPTQRTRSKPHQTMLAVLQGKWKKNNRPASFLPSNVNHCKKISNFSAICSAQLQKRQTDNEIITYNTQATLSNFAKNRFTIHYTNTIVDVKLRQIDRTMLTHDEDEDEDETDSKPVSSGIKVGDTSPQHEMHCELLEKNHIRCTRDKIHTYNFHG